MASMETTLANELKSLEGIHHQHPENGTGINEDTSYLKDYTNRLFGSPFQLLDSVDKRYSGVNKHLGSEYLRNIILNSPVLHIKPGMPKYTGGMDAESAIPELLKQVYMNASEAGKSAGLDSVNALMSQLAKATTFGAGGKLQKRMFGFVEDYHQYMSHVNYMCRSMAAFLMLTAPGDGQKSPFPNGAPSNKSATALEPFEKFKWENYRWLTSSKVLSPSEKLGEMGSATVLGTLSTAIGAEVEAIAGVMSGQSVSEAASEAMGKITAAAEKDMNSSVADAGADGANAVLFMVKPQSFEERFSNTAEDSLLERSIDGINESVGQELAFITNSTTDVGMVKGFAEFLGNATSSVGNFVNGLVEPVTGGFAGNLFNGALGSLKGQKMIYPKIYKRSSSEMNYSYEVTLATPYGDVYNYYKEIVVPLMHILALVSPRMITSNSISSPFLVQAFIPGMVTCQLGIISNLTITKNPEADRVSVHGYPLEIKVEFTIEELYNAMAISPANDPASFLFNETLNDYMANLGGLAPSRDTYAKQKAVTFEALSSYFENGEYLEDLANSAIHGAMNAIDAYTANGS